MSETTETRPAEDTAPVNEKRPRKKRYATIGVVAAVLVVAGVGFNAWHSQPSFCTSICHTPMNTLYLETLEAMPGQAATDKWGNNVADANGMLASVHGHVEGTTIGCLECHVPTIGEQVGEGTAWISGGYEVIETDAGDIMFEKNFTQLTEAAGDAPETFCLNMACHALTRDQLIQKTASMKRNVHLMPHENLDCGTCHKSHRASVNYCSKCHTDATIPDGWLTVEEEQALKSRAA